jgi:hypothetical protein
LSLAFIGTRYPGGQAAEAEDSIGLEGKDYQARYAKLHPLNRYRNRVYGRAAEGNDGLWPQYWFLLLLLQRRSAGLDQVRAPRRRLGDDPTAGRARRASGARGLCPAYLRRRDGLD